MVSGNCTSQLDSTLHVALNAIEMRMDKMHGCFAEREGRHWTGTGSEIRFDARLRFLIGHLILPSETLPHSEHATCGVAKFGDFLYFVRWERRGKLCYYNYRFLLVDSEGLLHPYIISKACLGISLQITVYKE